MWIGIVQEKGLLSVPHAIVPIHGTNDVVAV